MTLVELFESYSEAIGAKLDKDTDDCGCIFMQLTGEDGLVVGYGIQTTIPCAQKINESPMNVEALFEKAA